jgi:L-fucose isomerase-like protein
MLGEIINMTKEQMKLLSKAFRIPTDVLKGMDLKSFLVRCWWSQTCPSLEI